MNLLFKRIFDIRKRYLFRKCSGSSLPWRDLMRILGTIALTVAPRVSTQWNREARSGTGFHGSRFNVQSCFGRRFAFCQFVLFLPGFVLLLTNRGLDNL